MTTSIAVANAPISYGAFELTVGMDRNVPNGVAILDEVAAAGYAGIDLGPVGYLGDGRVLAQRLATRNLGLAGAYLEFPFIDPEALAGLLPELDAMLDTFDAVRESVPGPPPRPTIADNGSEARRAAPGSGVRNPASGYDERAWDTFAVGLAAVVDRCRARGYEPTFHHETGSFVESPAEIEQVLALSDVGLCLDTGHLLVGGGDPPAFLRKWAHRVNHVHAKDALHSVFDGIVAGGGPTTEIWSREAFPVLGAGDAAIDSVLQALSEIGYEGWLVVEQDILPQTAERFASAVSDQRYNREYLARRGL